MFRAHQYKHWLLFSFLSRLRQFPLVSEQLTLRHGDSLNLAHARIIHDSLQSFPTYLILMASLGPGFTQPLTEMSTRGRKIIFLGSSARQVRRADRFAAICKPIVYTMWDS
jgi:hypothetical protein